MAMVPHERSLVKRLEGKPFVLLGVNLDETREEERKTETKHQISWRSWFDGREGPICKAWRITDLPAIYVLDEQGVIRYKGVREEALDQAVDKLITEVTKKKR